MFSAVCQRLQLINSIWGFEGEEQNGNTSAYGAALTLPSLSTVVTIVIGKICSKASKCHIICSSKLSFCICYLLFSVIKTDQARLME
jgi:hypothetical protein